MGIKEWMPWGLKTADGLVSHAQPLRHYVMAAVEPGSDNLHCYWC